MMEAVGADEGGAVGRPDVDPWTPVEPLARAAAAVDGWLHRITRGRWWAWQAVGIAVVVGMVLAGPPVGGFQSPRAVVWRYDFANSGPQLFDPHVNLHDATGNLTFRFVPRLIGAAFGFDSQWQFYVMQLVFGVLLLWAVAQIYDQVLGSRVQATLLTVATACTWAGATAWVETRGLFDVVGIALLALCMRTRRPWLALFFALAASFSDERALIALPVVICWHAFRPDHRLDEFEELHAVDEEYGAATLAPIGTEPSFVRRFLRPLPLLVALTFVLHLGIRTWLKHRYGLVESHNRYPDNPYTQLRNYPNGIWGAFEGLWLVIVAGVATLVHRRQWALALLFGLVGIPSLLVGMSVVDVSRAIAYAWPLAPLAALGLRGLPAASIRRLVWIATGVCAVWPMVYAAGDQTVDWFYPAPLVIVHLATGRL